MDMTKLAEYVGHAWHSLPEKVLEHLQDVNVMICRDPAHATEEMNKEFEGEPPFAADVKGAFMGEPMETEESSTDDEENEVVYFPDGYVFIIASNVADEKEGVAVFLHEIGHALGMDEEEVSQLGLGVGPKEEDTSADKPNTAAGDA